MQLAFNKIEMYVFFERSVNALLVVATHIWLIAPTVLKKNELGTIYNLLSFIVNFSPWRQSESMHEPFMLCATDRVVATH